MIETLITPKSTITLHFALKLADGSVVDSTFDKEPCSLTLGDGNLPANFETPLIGLSTHSKQTFQLGPEQAFGLRREANIQQLPKSRFHDDLTLAPGMILSFEDANGAELPGIVQALNDHKVTVDFNHPLAGRTLLFEVEILAVSPPNAHAQDILDG